MDNSISKPRVILLDFDGTVISSREIETPELALNFAREQSCRVDSAYAIIGGKIHFFRYGMLFELSETSCNFAMSA